MKSRTKLGVITDHNKGCHIDRSDLPKINGIDIDGIWCPDQFADDIRVLDETDWSYSTPNPFTKGIKDVNKIGTLPQEFKDLLGHQVINGKKTFVRSISFRTESSGHASIDSFMTIYCGGTSMSVWHSKNGGTTLNENNEYVKKWLDLCGKKLTIKYVPNPDQTFIQHFPYPQLKDEWNGTMFKTIDGLNYPTMYSTHWIPFGHKPYISNSNGVEDMFGCPVRDNIRMFDENMNAHIYLERVKDVKKNDENLVRLSFPREMGMYYVHITYWNKTDEYVRYTVETKHKDGGFTLRAYKDGVKDHTAGSSGYDLYRINSIVKSSEKKSKKS